MDETKSSTSGHDDAFVPMQVDADDGNVPMDGCPRTSGDDIEVSYLSSDDDDDADDLSVSQGDDDDDYDEDDDDEDDDDDDDNDDGDDDNSTPFANPASHPTSEVPTLKNTGKKLWDTLEHNGPLLPPAFKPLPEEYRLVYGSPNGPVEIIKLKPGAEEVAMLYLEKKERFNRLPKERRQKFIKNFMTSWWRTMESNEREKIRKFHHCDFRLMEYYLKQDKSETNQASSKEARKKAKEDEEKIYRYCLVNGSPEKIRKYTIQGPALFFPRNDDGRIGSLKQRITAADVEINRSGTKEPRPANEPEWHSCSAINTKYRLARWRNKLTGQWECMRFHPSSIIMMTKTEKKFDKARKLGEQMHDKIRPEYEKLWNTKETSQMGVAIYLLDRLVIRAGNKKPENTGDTYGLCSLKISHVRLCKRKGDRINLAKFTFLGKGGVLFKKTISVPPLVYQRIREIAKGKSLEDELFDQITPSKLNKSLDGFMPGLTAVVFRHYHASATMERELNNVEYSDLDPREIFERANRKVARLLNHRRRDLDGTSEPSLKTSILNYIDPRIIVAWWRKRTHLIDKVFTEEELAQFEWAMNPSSENYVFHRQKSPCL